MDMAEVLKLAPPGSEIHAELQAAITRGLSPLEVPTPMRLSTWMIEHFYLSEESSYEKGKWTPYPWQVAPTDCIGHDGIPFVTWRKSARVGYTKIFLAALCYFAEHKRRNQVVYQPTDEDRDDFVTTELEPALRDIKVMRRVFPKFNRKSKDNTMKKKRFIGCLLHARGGKAAKNYRRLTADNVYYDETDGFDNDIEKEGSPFKLGNKRTEGATFPKSVAGSTPKIKGLSLIEAREAEADYLFEYYIRCPHCSEEHTLEWGGKDRAHGMKWVDDNPASVYHACPHCGGAITQADYLRVWQGRWKGADGTWIDESDPDDLHFRDADDQLIPLPRHVAFHIWTAYSPQATWASLVEEWISAARKARTGDDSDLKTFKNTTLGQTYEVELERTEASSLERRAEPYALRTVPYGGVKVLTGIDVQNDRWECISWAVGRGEEMWAVDYTVIYGNPADQREWDKLDGYLATTFTHACGAEMSIEAAAIDTGGHFTHQAYVYVRNRPNRKLFAVKGESISGKPIKSRSSLQDVNERGRVIRKGVRLWYVGTDTAKDLLYGRLQVTTPGAGCVHFSKELPADFYKQLTAESRVPVKTSRGEEHRWIKPPGARNEVLDATNYVLFLVQALELHKYTDKLWDRLEQALEPDLFSARPEPAREASANRVAPALLAPRADPEPTAIPAERTPAVSRPQIASTEWSSRL